jgi:hypothetical protein
VGLERLEQLRLLAANRKETDGHDQKANSLRTVTMHESSSSGGRFQKNS